ncbi:efflux RND transporter periplasmic adaptor subunit [Xylophilus sp. GOD-11R]|uniref:efflux RND transporter periplasmic adaptor subunit n=1 Tax=Xylophilus sp. GOD-11R TaxID=3089814 RepID=UPI00298CD7C5|nr:efflux RND transporter periplasmic adaptor subunit [Xylophilus sp. GOD-11R]WPB57555.1 efflux RND transporter periplasmic adaptor subunit [Xylophilus sp. GOD-11R]
MISNRPLRTAAQRLPALGALAALSLFLVACSDKKAAAPPAGPAEVGVVTLKPQTTVFTTELPGRTSAFLAADIRPQVGGIVQQRLFTEGATVRAGQPLYQIDPSTYKAALSSAEAALARSKATSIAADATAGRNAELVRIDAVSKQVNDQSQAALAQSKADVATAQASVDTARINLAFTRLTSPISGRIGTSTVTPGALVTANQATALATVQQIDPLYVDVTQSSAEVLRLKRDFAAGRLTRSGADAARIKLLLEDGSPYGHDGRLQFAGISVNQTTGAVTLRATVPNPEGLLLPGMYVRAVVEEGSDKDALLAPQQGVLRDAVGRASALVVDQNNKVQRKTVNVGRAIGNRWLVRDGLAAGDRLVVEGSMRVKPGDTVKAVEMDLAALTAAAGKAAATGATDDAAAAAPAGAAVR